jgi:hypothetical protein
MWLLLAEALLALALLVGIVGWTMAAARRGARELEAERRAVERAAPPAAADERAPLDPR